MQKHKCKFTGSKTSVCGKEASPSPNSLISLTLSSCPEETFTCDRWVVQDEQACKFQSKQLKFNAQVYEASKNAENCNKNCFIKESLSPVVPVSPWQTNATPRSTVLKMSLMRATVHILRFDLFLCFKSVSALFLNFHFHISN